MICKSCGAEYDNACIRCPYCETENSEAMGKWKKGILQNYDREAAGIRKEMENYPQKTAEKQTKKIVFIVGLLAIIGIFLTFLFIMFGKLSVRIQYKQEQAHLNRLEELYQEEKYQEIDEYIRKNDLFGRNYQKYVQVVNINKAIEGMDVDLEKIQMIVAENFSMEEKIMQCDYWMNDVLHQAGYVLRTSREYADDQFFLENEQVLKKFYEDCVKKLVEWGYTEDEISQITQWDEDIEKKDLVQKLVVLFLEND